MKVIAQCCIQTSDNTIKCAENCCQAHPKHQTGGAAHIGEECFQGYVTVSIAGVVMKWFKVTYDSLEFQYD